MGTNPDMVPASKVNDVLRSLAPFAEKYGTAELTHRLVYLDGKPVAMRLEVIHPSDERITTEVAQFPLPENVRGFYAAGTRFPNLIYGSITILVFSTVVGVASAIGVWSYRFAAKIFGL